MCKQNLNMDILLYLARVNVPRVVLWIAGLGSKFVGLIYVPRVVLWIAGLGYWCSDYKCG